MRFFLAMDPPTCTAQEKKIDTRGAKPRMYDSREVTEARAKLRAHLAPHRPSVPLSAPIRLVVKWCFPITGKHRDGEYKTTRPDTDNLAKMFKDVMEDLGFFANDAHVASEIIEKFWAAQPGIYVEVTELHSAAEGK